MKDIKINPCNPDSNCDDLLLSPILGDELSKSPIMVEGNVTTLLLLKRYIETIKAIGEIEHDGDWYLSLEITFKDGTSLNTESGYPEIGLSDGENDDGVSEEYITAHNGIFSPFFQKPGNFKIGFFVEPFCELYDEDHEDELGMTWFSISDIQSIQLHIEF